MYLLNKLDLQFDSKSQSIETDQQTANTKTYSKFRPSIPKTRT